MPQTPVSDFRDAVIAFAVFFALCVGWYIVYVQPADAARAAIMDCMAEQGDLHSRDAYDACVADLRGGE